MGSGAEAGLAALCLASAWYGLLSIRAVKGILAIALSQLALAGLLVELDLAYLAAVGAPVLLAPALIALLLSLARGEAVHSPPPVKRRLIAAAAGTATFAILTTVIYSAELPVPTAWASAEASVMLGRHLLGPALPLLLTLAIALLTAALAVVAIGVRRTRIRRPARVSADDDRNALPRERSVTSVPGHGDPGR